MMLFSPLFLLLVAVSGDTVTVTTVTEARAAPAASAAPQFVNYTLFTSAILNSTNVYRADYNATPMHWNDTLAAFAASYLASDSDCKFAHSGGPYGENIALGCSDVTGCVDLWGNERAHYHWGDPGFSEQTGHFTQLVWKNSTEVGCGRKLCGKESWFLVCEYWPRGNVIGEFADEVGKQVNGTGSGVRPPPGTTSLALLVALGLWASL